MRKSCILDLIRKLFQHLKSQTTLYYELKQLFNELRGRMASNSELFKLILFWVLWTAPRSKFSCSGTHSIEDSLVCDWQLVWLFGILLTSPNYSKLYSKLYSRRKAMHTKGCNMVVTLIIDIIRMPMVIRLPFGLVSVRLFNLVYFLCHLMHVL